MTKQLLKNTLAAAAVLLALMFALPQSATAQEKEAYAVLDAVAKTLTFYYDANKAKHTEGMAYDIPVSDEPRWIYDDNKREITTVSFDASFDAYRPTTTSSWFDHFGSLTTFNGIEYLHTDQVTNMSNMFWCCNALQTLNLSGFNTSNVTNMGYMLSECNALTELDISGWNTASVTTMYNMFSCCFALQKLDVSGWNTANVITMGNMFDSCHALQRLDISEWNTSNLIDMSFMFRECSALQTLDLSGWDTAKVKYMSEMFSDCSALQKLDVSGWNTTKVNNMNYMFYGCKSLQTLNLSDFNNASAVALTGMFANCSSLTELDLTNFNTARVNDMDAMFYGCSALTTIYCNDTWTCDYSKNMFLDCNNLKGAVAYDTAKTDATMANPETGYFTKKDVTAIDGVNAAGAPILNNRAMYNLAGQRVGKDYKGIVIKDGRKMVRR